MTTDKDLKIAKLEGEVSQLKHGGAQHSTAKTVAICSLVAALVGAPGFWNVFNPKQPPPPVISVAEKEEQKRDLDQVKTDISEIKLILIEEKTFARTKFENIDKFMDNLTPPNKTKIPK